MRRGSITIYLALVLTLLLSVFMTLILGAFITATKLKFELASDAALTAYSAEYRKELFDMYDLLFVDTSYGGEFSSLDGVQEHISNILKENCNPTQNRMIYGKRSMLPFEEVNVEINGIEVATDHQGIVFKEEAISYIKSKLGIEEIELLVEQARTVENSGVFALNCKTERENTIKKMDTIAVVPEEDKPKEEWTKITVDDPAADINAIRQAGILPLLIEDFDRVSGKNVELETYVSHRKNNEGMGEWEQAEQTLTDEILFAEYISEKCKNYIDQPKKQYLCYECEYIIGGKNSDVENLKEVVTQLLWIRETMNTIHILADTTKMTELSTVAAAVSAVLVVPELEPLIKYAMVFSWAYAEALSDVKTLLKGEKVAFLKTKEQWDISLENALAGSFVATDVSDKEGLTYEAYLKILLCKTNSQKKVYRMMDLVEMGVRSKGFKNFRLDQCARAIEVTFIGIDTKGQIYSVRKKEYY